MRRVLFFLLFVSLTSIQTVSAQSGEASDSSEADLAKKLQNPVAALVSLPFKLDFDGGIGSTNAGRETFVVQPVIPISIGNDWIIISRTIVPYVDAQPFVEGGSSVSGLADTLQSLFLSPKSPTSGGWIWGAGPAISLPTGNDTFGSGKWSLGPTAVLLRQGNGWTYGVLVNQIWSVGGSSSRAPVSSAFFQPFLSYTTKTFTTFGVNAETSMNWETSQATVPVNATVSQLLKIDGQPVSLLFGGRVYLNRPSGGPDWGLRFQMSLLFPKS